MEHSPAIAPALLDAIGTDRAHLHIQKVLTAVRAHLGMDLCFLSQFIDGRRVFRNIDSGVPNPPIAVGGSDPLEESYCQRVVDGRLPELMTNASENTEALTLPATLALGIGAHISVPIRLPDGTVYGTFCCFRFTPDRSLNERDLQMLRAFAAILADLIHTELETQRERDAQAARIRQVIADRSFHAVYQPIFRLSDDRIDAFESLARFRTEPVRSPDVWFNEAAAAGLGEELELELAILACEALPVLPEDVTLTVNLSPASVLTDGFLSLFNRLPLGRVVLEVTEHAAVANYIELRSALAPLRARGLRLAVDDAGAGHSSFRHVLALKPDLIKLDMSLTRDIDRDPARHALATALTTFGHAMGSEIVAEGVENRAELEALREIGVTKVQGFYLGKPMPLDEALVLTGRATPVRKAQLG